MPTTIRRLELTDAEASVALRKAMLADAPGSFGSSPTQDRGSDPAEVRNRLASWPEEAGFGAFAPGLIGSVGLRREVRAKENHKAFIWGMFVAPEFRRQGLGRQLMQAAIEHASTLDGVERIHLSVTDASPGAHALYASLGFVTWGTEPDALRVNGTSYAEHHMALTL